MKVAIVHNCYGKLSGEEVVVEGLSAMLAAYGHKVLRFSRSSEEIPGKRFGQAQAFLCGIYNPFSRRVFGRFLDAHKPDVVHVHNLFPFISPSILPECARRRVPVVMTLHNFRLVCPNALLMRKGEICHDCLGGHEWRCVWNSCERSFPKSFGYALRTAFARRSGLVRRHVTQFICLTQFQREIYVREGFPPDRLTAIPNPAPEPPDVVGPVSFSSLPSVEPSSPQPPTPGCAEIQQSRANSQPGFVGYVGRVSPEKDVPTLLAAARLLPEIPFKIAGDYWRMPELLKGAPANVEFLGHLQKPESEVFFRGMKLMAFATCCYENFPLTILDAMARNVPIVCTRIGGLPEIVDDGVTGLLYAPGDAADLAKKIKSLWSDAALCERLGQHARAELRSKYATQVVYDKTMRVYERAIRGVPEFVCQRS